MGAQTTQPSAGSSSSRRAKTFAMDDQTRFLYFILKQLDLKTINWQQVADNLGIKNGHAARMRWSRFKCHVEGVPATNNKKKDERNGKTANAKNTTATKRDCLESGKDKESDPKRVKMEQGWAAIPGSYGQHPPPPPPYYSVDPSYGMLPPHPSSFGTIQPHLFALQPHGPNSFPPQPLSQSFGPTIPAPGTINPASITNSSTSALIKAESDPPPVLPILTGSRDEPTSVLIKSEHDRTLLGEPDSSAPSTMTGIDTIQEEETQNSKTDFSFRSTGMSAGPPAVSQDADGTTSNHEQQKVTAQPSDSERPRSQSQNQEIKVERSSVNRDLVPEAPLFLAEVSKEDFTRAVDAEAAAHAQYDPIVEPQAASPRQGDPPSPEIPLATLKAQAIHQEAASTAGRPSTAQVQSVSAGPFARSLSRGVSSNEKSPPSKPRLSTAAKSPPSTYVDPQPAEFVLARTSAPPLPTASTTVTQHCIVPPYALPNGSYFHPLFSNHQPQHPVPHPYWHHPPLMRVNGPSSTLYPVPHPPMSAPPTFMSDWNDNSHPFNHHAYPQAAPLHEYGRLAMSAPTSQTNLNSGTLITTSQTSSGQVQDPATRTTEAGTDSKGFKVTPDANMDMLVPSIDEFDPLGFDFQVGQNATVMGGRLYSGPMEPQHVIPDRAGLKHDACGSGAEEVKEKDTENEGEMG